MGKHALLSPSGADRWMTCPGSVLLTKDLPEQTSEYAQEGTNYHLLAQLCLEQEKDAFEFVGMPFEDETVVDEGNAEYVQLYIDHIREETAKGGTVVIEDKLPLAQITGEKDAEGTSDCTIIRDDVVVVRDLKFGRGVAVKAENNRQLKMYALGAIEKHQLWDIVKEVDLGICQPRLTSEISQTIIPIDELKMFKQEVQIIARPILKALQTGERLPLNPSEKACKFCKAAKAGICDALTMTVRNAAEEGFENLDEPKIVQTPKGPVTVSEADRLGEMMKLADLAEIYVKGVRSAVESALFASRPVTGYKLVQGRKGSRQWADEKATEEVLKKKRVKHEDMYTYKLITPTKAEKKWAKEKPTWWKELSEEGRISQSSGSISVAPTEDPRPAYTVEPQESGFEESVEDLF